MRHYNFLRIILVSLLLFLSINLGMRNAALAGEKEECLKLNSIFEQIGMWSYFFGFSLAEVPAHEITKNVTLSLNSSPEVAVFFIQRNIRLLENIKNTSMPFPGEKALKMDLAFSYARHGMLLNHMGKAEEAKKAFTKALSVVREAESKINSLDKLLEVLQELDKNANKTPK